MYFCVILSVLVCVCVCVKTVLGLCVFLSFRISPALLPGQAKIPASNGLSSQSGANFPDTIRLLPQLRLPNDTLYPYVENFFPLAPPYNFLNLSSQLCSDAVLFHHDVQPSLRSRLFSGLFF